MKAKKNDTSNIYMLFQPGGRTYLLKTVSLTVCLRVCVRAYVLGGGTWKISLGCLKKFTVNSQQTSSSVCYISVIVFTTTVLFRF